jgi:hypothetical protein
VIPIIVHSLSPKSYVNSLTNIINLVELEVQSMDPCHNPNTIVTIIKIQVQDKVIILRNKIQIRVMH